MDELRESVAKDVAFEKMTLRSEWTNRLVSLFPFGKVTFSYIKSEEGVVYKVSKTHYPTLFPMTLAPSLASDHFLGKQFLSRMPLPPRGHPQKSRLGKSHFSSIHTLSSVPLLFIKPLGSSLCTYLPTCVSIYPSIHLSI